jgi:predicted RNase H-like HicB family nuclease
MDAPMPESLAIVLGQEDDGRWWADIESMPGVMAYGPTREAAVAAVRALALRVAADCIDHGEGVLQRSGWPKYTFAFHDTEEIGPGLLGQIAKKTGLRPEDL